MTTGLGQHSSRTADPAPTVIRAAAASASDLSPGTLPATPGGTTIRRLIHYLQALEDAVDYRRARASEPCQDCDAAPEDRCEDHDRDVDLIGEYAETHRLIDEAIAAASAAQRAARQKASAAGIPDVSERPRTA